MLLWAFTLLTCLLHTSAESCTHHAALGQRFDLPLPLPKENRIRWKFGSKTIYDSRSNSNSHSVTAQGALILPTVSPSNSGDYTVETVNKDGQTKQQTLHLCVHESVSKPTVTVKCDKLNKVQFTCSVPQKNKLTYQWAESGKIIDNEKGGVLVRTLTQLGSNSFTCKVSNPASSQTSDPTKSDCVKIVSLPKPTSRPEEEEEASLFGLPFWLMVGILAGGGGLVLVLIVATIVCCSINRKKRRMHMKDEQELRLQLSTENYQNHQCTNQRGHAHSHVAAPSQRPTPSPRPNTAAPHGPMSAGHTGPRPPRAGRNRPRPPDPITGQPLPGPRRLPETGQTQIPSVNDDENPPPLPQPRKKGHRT